MDQCDIKNTVESACAFRVVAAGTSNVSPCLIFLVWYVKSTVRKLATKIFRKFCSYFGLMPLFLFLGSKAAGA